MQHSTNRILTSHVGSLVRPPEIAAMFPNRPAGQALRRPRAGPDRAQRRRRRPQQDDAGIDIPSDGEFSKSGFAGYISDRLSGFEERGSESQAFTRGRDRIRFAEAYAEMEGGGLGVGQIPLVCTGPVTYVGQDAPAHGPRQPQGRRSGRRPRRGLRPRRRARHHRPAAPQRVLQDATTNTSTPSPTPWRSSTRWSSTPASSSRSTTRAWSPPTTPWTRPPAAAEYRKFAMHRVEALNHALKGLPGGQRPLPRLLGQLARPAHHRHRAQGHRRRRPRDQRQLLLRRGRQPAPRPRVPRLGDDEAARRQAAHARRHRPRRPTSSSTRSSSPNASSSTPTSSAARTSSPASTAASPRATAPPASTPAIQWEKLRMLSEGARLASQHLWR